MKAIAGKVRLIDVAREAGVDRTVAGKVLLGSGGNTRVSEATAERIRKVAQRLRYQPNQIARQLKGAPSRLIGVLVSGSMNQPSQQRLIAAEREAYRRGYRLTIGQIHGEDAQEHLSDFDARGAQALLFLDSVPEAAAPALARHPRVLYSIHPPAPIPDSAPCFELDRYAASAMTVEHLAARGRQRIGLIMSRLSSYTANQRYTGHLDTLRRLGLPCKNELIWTPARSSPKPLEQIDLAIEELVGRQGCDALACGSDDWAVAAVKAVRRAGRSVPKDVAVAGFNNLDVATAIEPELTTIDHRHEELARIMIDRAVQWIETGELPESQRHLKLPPTLVVRQST